MGTFTCWRARASGTAPGSPEITSSPWSSPEAEFGRCLFLLPLESSHWRHADIATQTFGICSGLIQANSGGPRPMHSVCISQFSGEQHLLLVQKGNLHSASHPASTKAQREVKAPPFVQVRNIIFALPKQIQWNKTPRFGPFVNHLTTKVYKFISPFHCFIYPAALKVLKGQWKLAWLWLSQTNKAGMDMELHSATHPQNFSFPAIKAQSKLHFPDCQFLYAFFRAQM